MTAWTAEFGTTSELLCGSLLASDTKNLRVLGRVTHSSTTLQLRVISQLSLSSSQESFGFRDINLLFINTSSALTNQVCGIPPNIVSSNKCACAEGTYESPVGSGVCKACNSLCQSCFGPSAAQCLQCASGSSYDGSKCIQCGGNCKVCYGTGESQCTVCKPGYFLYSNNTCLPTCSSPFTQKTTQENTLCNAPCNSTEFYDWNDSCQASCESPLKSSTWSGINFCSFPCSDNESLYYNGTCSQDCRYPFKNMKHYNKSFCEYPCSSAQYLYQNGSCIDSCPSPLLSYAKSEGQYCEYPCSTSEFLYWNKSCIASCQSPFKANIENGERFCNLPCDNASEYYYTNDSICRQTCLTQDSIYLMDYKSCVENQQASGQGGSNSTGSTNLTTSLNSANLSTISNSVSNSTDNSNSNSSTSSNSSLISSNNTSNFTNSSIPGSSISSNTTTDADDDDAKDAQIAKSAANILDTGITALSVSVVLSNALGTTNPASFALAGFIKMLPYIRYMEIKYPKRLQMMLDNMNSTLFSFSFGPAITPNVQSQFKKYKLPGKFDQYQFHSAFLVNYWQNMTSLAIILGVILVLSLLSFTSKLFKKRIYILEKLKLIVKWNFFLMIFCTNFDGIVLGTSLELRTTHLNTPAAAISFISCLFFNALSIFILGLLVHIIRDLRRAQYKVSPIGLENKRLNRWEEYQVFYAGSKEDSLIRHIFMFPYLLRLYLFNFTISYVFSYPLAQTIIITLLNLIILLYILVIKPFKSKLVFCQHSTDELTMLLINTCILTLSILDHNGDTENRIREVLGDVIIGCNIFLSITANIYLFLYLCVGFKAAFTAMKTQKKQGFLLWLAALLAPFEAGGMDLEVTPAEPETPSPGLCLIKPKILEIEDKKPKVGRVQFIKKIEIKPIPRQESNIILHLSDQDMTLPDSLIIKKNPSSNASPSLDTTKQMDSLEHVFSFERVQYKKRSRFNPSSKVNTRTEIPKDPDVELVGMSREYVFELN